jgi:hypothetical protein
MGYENMYQGINKGERIVMQISKLGAYSYQYVVNVSNFVFFDGVVVNGAVLLLMRGDVHVGNVYHPDKDRFLDNWEKIQNELSR